MARFLSGTFGKISGKHGSAVAIVMKGKTILRIYTPPTNPNTKPQQAQRLKFAMVAKVLAPMRNIITVGFGEKQGYYQATSLAMRNAISGTYPYFSVIYNKVILSNGSLPLSPVAGFSVLADGNFLVDWDRTLCGNGASDDEVKVAFFNPATQMAVFVEAQAKRDDGTLTTTPPATWMGTTIHAWLFFTSAGGKQSSVCQYIGSVEMA